MPEDFESLAQEAQEQKQMQDDDRLYEQAERMEIWREMWDYQND